MSVTIEEVLQDVQVRLAQSERREAAYQHQIEMLLNNLSMKVDQKVAREVSIPLPNKFTGDRASFRAFVNKLELIFKLQPESYPTDAHKIGLVTGLLTGKAEDWLSGYIERSSDILSNYSLFMTEFRRCFEDVNRKVAAETRLRRLKQGSRAVHEYVTEFVQLVTELGWDEASVLHQFEEGLNDNIYKLLMLVEAPNSLQAAVDLAYRLERRVLERQARRGPRAGYSPNVHPRASPTTSWGTTRSSSPHPGSEPAVSARKLDGDERVPMELDHAVRGRGQTGNHQQTRRCFICGQLGHVARICAKRAVADPHHARGVAAIETVADQEEDAVQPAK
jgi:hypothetical protein